MAGLTYGSTATRPDIAAAVGSLSQYMPQPSKDHWIGVKRLTFTAHEEEPELFG